MNHSPADILATLLCDGSAAPFTEVGDNLDWPVYVGHMPDEGTDPAACVRDTTGQKTSRISGGGSQFKYGFQIKGRAADYRTGFAKLTEVSQLLDTVSQRVVTLDGTEYLVDCIVMTSPVLALGQDDMRRDMFTINGMVLLKQTS